MFLHRILIVCLILIPFAAAAEEAERRLTVSARSSIETVPDMATVTLGVQSQARTAGAALSANSADMADVLAVVKSVGIADADIQTSGLSLNPDYRHSSNSQPQIVGYTARNQVHVRVRDLEKLGPLMDAVTRSGANLFNGLSFGLQEPEPLADEALSQAIAKARARAELMAAAAGVQLGPLVQIYESGGGQPAPIMARDMAMMEAAVPVAEGSVSVSSHVTLVYQLID